MSIRGNSQELYIGKQSVYIQDWMYNRKTINYENISKIDYCFRALTEGGYIDFHDEYGHFERFRFPRKSNGAIQRSVDYIQERCPDLEITRHETSDDPFYTKGIFIALISVFCLWPVGLILFWCTGKRTLKERIVFTVAVLIVQIALFGLFSYWRYIEYQNTVNSVNDYMNQIQRMIWGN